ncbi:hypothetical protein [Brucella melitensis]|uniref:hypothetical protein n=1 Tax=Brucella melitensis TaxID=29459 RepID=UPI0024533CC8|nr:hypothetical protein [Brucella melitensis]
MALRGQDRGDANIGKGIYTHFLDDEGMVRADFTAIRMADRIRMINGADAARAIFIICAA